MRNLSARQFFVQCGSHRGFILFDPARDGFILKKYSKISLVFEYVLNCVKNVCLIVIVAKAQAAK